MSSISTVNVYVCICVLLGQDWGLLNQHFKADWHKKIVIDGEILYFDFLSNVITLSTKRWVMQKDQF